MKGKDLLLIGGLAIGGYLLYKIFSGGSSPISGGGYSQNWLPFDQTPKTPINQDQNTPTAKPPAQQPGQVYQAPINDVIVTVPKLPGSNEIPFVNTQGAVIVPVKNTIPNTTGGQNFPTVTLPSKYTVQPPLKITNIFGFPVVPHVVQTAPTTKPTVTVPLNVALKPWR